MSVLFQYLSIIVHSLLLFLLNQVLVYLSGGDIWTIHSHYTHYTDSFLYYFVIWSTNNFFFILDQIQSSEWSMVSSVNLVSDFSFWFWANEFNWLYCIILEDVITIRYWNRYWWWSLRFGRFSIGIQFDRSNMQSNRKFKFVSNKRLQVINHSINQSIDVVVDHH